MRIDGTFNNIGIPSGVQDRNGNPYRNTRRQTEGRGTQGVAVWEGAVQVARREARDATDERRRRRMEREEEREERENGDGDGDET